MRPEVTAWITAREATVDRVRRLLVTRLALHLEPEDIDPDTALFGTGLGLDSVDVVELVLALEGEFGVTIPDELDARRILRTVNAVVDHVMGAGGAGAS